MSILKQIVCASALVGALLSTAIAQESASAAIQSSSLIITAAAAGERVRISAPTSIVRLHVEVYAASGEKAFDQEIRGGNVFDWNLQDGHGQRLAPGTYVCVVTAKSVSGRLTQKIGTVSVAVKSASVQPADSQKLSAAQSQTIGPVEENSSWTIAGDEPQTTTVIAHDGTDGQLIRGRGALSFRIGNFFTGNDTEQMRLTDAGDLGIGTSDPRARLDVAGTIRAERYLVVRPKLSGAEKTATSTLLADAMDPGQSLISGSGTQDRIAKWIDNSGTLGDSGITETAGLVGIGTTTPDSKLVVSSNSATLPPATSIARFAAADGVQTAVFADAFGTNPLFNVRRANGTAASPSAVQANQLLGVIGASGFGASAYSGTRARVGFFASENWTNTANGTFVTFNTTANGAATAGGAERLRIDNIGNVGIGTTNPTTRLDVVGNINTSTQYNIGGNRVLGLIGTGTTFAGVGAGPAIVVGINNSFFGGSAGNTSIGNDNSFFGEETSPFNNSGSRNSFFGHHAGFFTTSGSDNTFIGDLADLESSAFSGNKNVLIGAGARISSGIVNVDNAGAIGANAQVTRSNSLVLGSINNVNAATADTSVGIGLTAPNTRLDVVSSAAQIRFGNSNSDSGGYLVSTLSSQAIISGGARWSGSAWIAKSTSASMIDARSGGINFFGDSGLTSGSSFTPTKRMVIQSDGDVGITTLGSGLILKATDNASVCYRVTVNAAGALSTASVTCP
jgi:hypothetical protein